MTGANAAPDREEDLRAVDGYLEAWDRFARGERELSADLRAGAPTFEEALTRLLAGGDPRAPARLVFYAVVQIGGAIPLDTELGRAARALLHRSFPTRSGRGGECYFAADLYRWWEERRGDFDLYPLLSEWEERDFTKQVVIPVYRRVEGREGRS